MNNEIIAYNLQQHSEDQKICDLLSSIITAELAGAENKIWHRHPVWFLNGNPIVGYSKQKPGIRLMFWSGKDFEEINLNIHGGKLKDASIFYNDLSEIIPTDLKRWIQKSKEIQWDYKNIVKKKGRLDRLV
jgi:hypothetical protein